MILIKVIGMIEKGTKGRKIKYGLFKCPQCLREKEISFYSIAKSKKELCRECCLSNLNKTHGMSETKLYQCWTNMKNRCFSTKNKKYIDYGGRGITVCIEWKNDFKAFYDWAIVNGYKEGLSIDRIDNDKNYEPSNCRWVTQFIQTRNTRIRIDNKSGYRGVFYDVKNNFYQVNIMANKISKYLGSFKTIEKAAIAYDKYVVENNLEHNSNGLYKKDNA